MCIFLFRMSIEGLTADNIIYISILFYISILINIFLPGDQHVRNNCAEVIVEDS